MNLQRAGGLILLLLLAIPVIAEEPLPAGAKMKFLVPGAAPGNRPWCVAFSPDGKTLAVGASDKQIHLFDVATGRHLRCFGSHLDYVWTVAFSPDGKWIASGGRADFPVRIWNLEGEEQKPCEGEHHGGITKIKFFKDGKKLIMSGGSWDPTVRVWDFPNRKQMIEMRGHSDYIDAMDLASHERIAITSSRDGTWRLWDVRTGRQIGQGTIESQTLTDVGIAKDGRSFAICDGREFTIFETTTREARLILDEGHRALAYSPDGRLVATVGGSTPLCIRDSATGAEYWRERHQHSPEAGDRAVTFSSDGQLVAICGSSGTVSIWQSPQLWQLEQQTIALSDKERVEAWNELASPRARVGLRALLCLQRDNEVLEAFLAARLKPAAAPDSQRFARLIECLGSKKFVERDEASRHLASAGEGANSALLAAWATDLTPEARSRVRRLLERLDAVPPPETLQTLRAVELLERRGKPEAITILKRLAAGAPGFAVTIDAQETLERMEKRK
jgi:hypothetical protein